MLLEILPDLPDERPVRDVGQVQLLAALPTGRELVEEG